MTNLRYQDIPIVENGEPMIEAGAYGFFTEPQYFNAGYTTNPHLFMREGLARLLHSIEVQSLKTHGLRFKIWDPWRPRSLQGTLYSEFYNRLKKENPAWDDAKLAQKAGVYVTPVNSERIPPHATGGTIDLTLCDKNGVDINMGTTFDHFGPEAALDYFEEPRRDEKIRDNRRLLKEVLIDAGMNADTDEWWHYDFGNQKWALGQMRSKAFYGEVVDCELKPDKSVSCRFLQA